MTESALPSIDPFVSLRVPRGLGILGKNPKYQKPQESTARDTDSTTTPTTTNPPSSEHITALCLLPSHLSSLTGEIDTEKESDCDSESEGGSIGFACDACSEPRLGNGQAHFLERSNCSWCLASGHGDGSCWLWKDRQAVRSLLAEEEEEEEEETRSSPILSLQYDASDDTLLVQRRNGTIGRYSIRTGQRQGPLLPYGCPHTFCSMTVPVHIHDTDDDSSMVVIPSRGSKSTIAILQVGRSQPPSQHELQLPQQHGMVTSLAAATGGRCSSSTCLEIACGMESGTVVFYQLSHMGEWKDCGHSKCELDLGQEPVLSLDMRYTNDGVCEWIAGLAGNEHDGSSTAEQRGRLVVGTVGGHHEPRLRARVSTTSNSNCGWYKANRAGIAICRYRSGGGDDIFGVGGWDHRVRLYSSSSGQPLAVLRGHTDSITAMAWAGYGSNLLATGSSNGQLLLWDIPRVACGR